MSKRTELWYRTELKRQVKEMTDTVERALEKPNGSFFMDDFSGFLAVGVKTLLKVLERFEKKDHSVDDEKIAQGFVNRGNTQNQQEVSKNLKNQTGIDLSAYLGNSPRIAEKVNAMTTANVQLIKSIRSQYLDKVQNAVTQAMVNGTLNKDLVQQIKDIGKTTEKRAIFIARDQSSKLNAALTQARHEDVGITKYTWSTSGDERVRESHAEKDGQVFEYANPPADTGHPGHDFNCRCVQIPYLDGVLVGANKVESKSEKAQNEDVAEQVPLAESTIEVMDKLKTLEVEYNPVKDLHKELTFDEIIDKLAGGDMTQGSCVSLALSYIGNRCGLDVTDYRGGKSREFFSRNPHTRKLLSADGIKMEVHEVAKEAKGTADILIGLPLNKEYYLSTGTHAAIVRRTDSGLEYLEMQSSVKNGWMPFNKYGTIIKTLQKRFGCRLSADKYGFLSKVTIAEVDSFKSRKSDLKEALGYINTSKDGQKKGSWGSEK